MEHYSVYELEEKQIDIKFLSARVLIERDRGDAYSGVTGDDNAIELEYWKALHQAESERCDGYRTLYLKLIESAL